MMLLLIKSNSPTNLYTDTVLYNDKLYISSDVETRDFGYENKIIVFVEESGIDPSSIGDSHLLFISTSMKAQIVPSKLRVKTPGGYYKILKSNSSDITPDSIISDKELELIVNYYNENGELPDIQGMRDIKIDEIFK